MKEVPTALGARAQTSTFPLARFKDSSRFTELQPFAMYHVVVALRLYVTVVLNFWPVCQPHPAHGAVMWPVGLSTGPVFAAGVVVGFTATPLGASTTSPPPNL